MQKTEIVYKGNKPKESAINELKSLMPYLDITFTPFTAQTIKTVVDPIYKITTLDWVWFRTLFSKDVDISCLVLEQTDLAGLGITDHWGFYSLDSDTNHQFYMTNLEGRLQQKAINNGFKSNFARMFVHEYLHGAVWGNTRNRETAASLVHEWEKQGLLKQKLAEDVANYTKTYSLWEKLTNLVKKKLTSPLPAYWSTPVQAYGEANSRLYPITKHHVGVDLPTPVGTPFLAPLDCDLTRSGYLPKSLGYWCEIKLNGWYMVVCHLREQPKPGLYKQGQVMAYTGNTGLTEGPHCHCEGWYAPMDRSKLTKDSWNTLTFDVTTKI